MTTIRKATTKDKPALTETRLALQTHDESHNPRIRHTTPEEKRRHKKQTPTTLQDPDDTTLTAEKNGKPTGFASATTTRPHYTPERAATTNPIYAREGHRRRAQEPDPSEPPATTSQPKEPRRPPSTTSQETPTPNTSGKNSAPPPPGPQPTPPTNSSNAASTQTSRNPK